MNQLKIIGISGTNGSGKDTVGEMLAERHGYLFISVTNILREGLKKQGLPTERENTRNLSTQWRREHGLGVLIDKALDFFNSQKVSKDGSWKLKYKGLAIASLRHPGEVDRVHELGGQVVWVDADPKLRYKRIYSRARGTEDQKTYERFLAEEQAEMQNYGGDETTLNMSGVKAKADIFLENNGSLEEFKSAIKAALKL